MFNYRYSCLCVLIAVGILVSGCAPQTPPESPTSTPAPYPPSYPPGQNASDGLPQCQPGDTPVWAGYIAEPDGTYVIPAAVNSANAVVCLPAGTTLPNGFYTFPDSKHIPCPPPSVSQVVTVVDYADHYANGDPYIEQEPLCVQKAVYVASPTPLILLPYPQEVDEYCADPSKPTGGLQVWTANTNGTPSDSFNAAVTSGPNWGIVQSNGPKPANAPYHAGQDETRFLGPAGQNFTYQLCYHGLTGQNNCAVFGATYGTCSPGRPVGPSNGSGCTEPPSGCGQGQVWMGAPECSCTTIK